MHRAAQPAVESRIPREDLAIGSVDKSAEGDLPSRALELILDRTQHGSVAVRLENLRQLRFGKLADAGKTFGENLAMAAVRTKNKIFGPEGKGHADRGRFLSDRQMSRSGVVIRNTLIGALGLDFVEDGFELTDRAHVLPDLQKICRGVVPQFLFERAIVSVDGDFRHLDLRLGKNILRFDDNRLGHSLELLMNETLSRLQPALLSKIRKPWDGERQSRLHPQRTFRSRP